MAEQTGESLIVNKTIFNFLRNFGWTQVPKNRYVTLVFDMVSIKDVLPTMSKMENMPTHVLLFTVKVISGKGFQPIGNVFLYESTPAWKLSDCIKAYICDLERCELFVVATVCPPTKYLRSVVENLVEMNALQNKTDAHIYNVGNVNNIIHVYDAPSMLREVRNYFIRSPVTFKQFGEQCNGTYKDIKRILKATTNESLKTILEMKDNEEVNKYSIKLFSMSMSRELQKATNNDKTPHRGTANLCSFFDVLFDSFNGNIDYDNLNRRPLSSSSPHNKIWRDAIPVLKSMKFSAEPVQEKENSSLWQKQNPQVLSDNVIDVSLTAEAKRKQRKIKSTDQKIQEENISDRDLILNENQEKQKKKEIPDDGDFNKKFFPQVKQNKEKKIEQIKHADGNKLNGDISFDVKQDKQKKTRAIDQKTRKEHSDFKQVKNSGNVFQKKTKATIQPQNSDEKSSCIKQDEQKKIKATDQHIQREHADESNFTENITCVTQGKQKKTEEPDHHFKTEQSDSNQHIQPQNSDVDNLNEKLSSCIKQDEQKKIKATNQYIQRGHANDSSLTENISPQIKQGKQKKTKASDQHIWSEHSNCVQQIHTENSDDYNLTSSYIKQEKPKKTQITNQLDSSNNCNLNKNIPLHVKKETQMETKTTDQVENSVDRNLNVFLQVKKDKEKEMKALNEIEFGNFDDNNLNKKNRKKQLVSNPIQPLPEKFNKHKLDDVYECTTSNHSNELLSEPSYANSMLETLNDTQYLDMVLENIDKDINVTSLIYENSNESPNGKEEQYLVSEMEGFSEDKYKNYRKKLMTVLKQLANFKDATDLNDSNKTIANSEVRESNNISTNGPDLNGSDMYKLLCENVGATESFSLQENKERFVSTNVNSESGKVKNCINKLETRNADSNDNKRFEAFIKVSENPYAADVVSGRNLDVKTLKNCDFLHENFLIGNFHRKVNTSQEVAKNVNPAFEEMTLPKIVSQIVEQLQQKGMWNSSYCSDETSQDDNESETLENSTNLNCVSESKKLEHSTCTSNKHKVVEDKKNEDSHIRSNTRKKTHKTSDSMLKEDKNCSLSLLNKTNLSEINDKSLSNICSSNSNSEENNSRDDEKYMDVTEEASDIATNELLNDDGDDLNEMQNTRPYVLDAWIISINGMKEIYKILQQKHFQNINTKEFNTDCVKYMLHKVKQTNGVDHPSPVENEDYQVLDKDLVEIAFLPEASITLK